MKRSETVAMLQFLNSQPGSGHSRQHGFATWCEAVAMPRRTGSSWLLGCAPCSGSAPFIVDRLCSLNLKPIRPTEPGCSKESRVGAEPERWAQPQNLFESTGGAQPPPHTSRHSLTNYRKLAFAAPGQIKPTPERFMEEAFVWATSCQR